MAAKILKLNVPCKWTLPNNSSRRHVKLARCMPVQQQVDSGTMCESCNGRGWLLCDFCNGQKTNVKAENNRIYRRCPTCRAVDSGTMCESCNGRGWLLCDFCNGQKTNVKAENNRIYRRCPTCRATGCILCSKCKVFRCVTFPDHNDGEELIF